MLRWRLADAEGFVADLRRQQVSAALERWAVRCVCGAAWADAEEALDDHAAAPWGGLVARCKGAGVGFDEYVELSPLEEGALGRVASQQLREALPELWLDPLGAARPDATYEALDLAFGRAYELLAQGHREAGRVDIAANLEEADCGSSPDEWEALLSATQSAAELRPLAELLCPTSGAAELVPLDYEHITQGDLIDELESWVRRHLPALQGRRWERAELEAGLLIWIDPERALRTPWRTATERFITDRWTSRAVRYVALRRRAALAGHKASG